jgi:hypothetical protein
MQSRSDKLRQRLPSSAGHLRGRLEYFSHPESTTLVYEGDQAQVEYEPLRLSELAQLCIERRFPDHRQNQHQPPDVLSESL